MEFKDNNGGRWRIVDSGARCAASNIALDAAMFRLKQARRIPNTLRLLSFTKPSVLIGYHQSMAQEARLGYCHDRGIELNRRLTGGGAIYIDAIQIGWELIADIDDLPTGPVMDDITATCCRAAVRALDLLGVKASFRPRNDIEVQGRKLCGTGGVYEDGTLLFQGTLLVDFNPERMVKALRIPAEKLTRRELSSASQRVTCLMELLGSVPDRASIYTAFKRAFEESFSLELVGEGLTAAEEKMAARLFSVFNANDWVEGSREPAEDRPLLKSVHRGRGGIIRTDVAVDTYRRLVKSVTFSGDFFIQPRRALFDLEATLKECRFEEISARIKEFFYRAQPDCMGLSAEDFAGGLARAVNKTSYIQMGFSADEVNSINVLGGKTLDRVASRARLLLLPYCAKLPDCEFRTLDGCDRCGDCSVGDAYTLAVEAGLEPVSVNNYEELLKILGRYRRSGHAAFIGCCCSAFLVKHYQTFVRSGMDSILLDIENITCYELSQEQEAYRGEYRNQTQLKLELLRKVVGLRKVAEAPGRAGRGTSG